MNFARADANFGAQTEFAAVVEPGRRIDHHRRGVDPVDELTRSLIICRDNALGVFGAVELDVLDCLLHVFDDPDRENQIEIFLRPVVFRGPLDPRHHRAGLFTTTDLDAGRLKLGDHRRQKFRRDRFVHQQGFHGIADRGALNLGVEADALGCFQRRVFIDVHVTNSLVVLDHRNSGIRHHGAD